MTDKFKFECESWKTKFQDQFGDKNSLEKQVISLKQTTTKLRDDIDQIETEKGMWKTKYDELVRNRIENRTFKMDFPKIENDGHESGGSVKYNILG